MPLLVWVMSTNFVNGPNAFTMRSISGLAFAQAASRVPQQTGQQNRTTIQNIQRVALRRNINEGKFGVGINLR